MNNYPKWTDVAKAIGVWLIGCLLLLKILATEGVVISNLGSDVWVSISAAFIALCALGVSIQQIRLSERHNRLSVQPKLRVEYSRLEGGRIGLALTNNGLGPAIINRLLIKRQGNVYECNTGNFIQFLPKQYTKDESGNFVSTGVEAGFNYNCIGGGASLAAGESIWILYHDSPDALQISYWSHALMGVSIDAEYESMYGQYFSHNLCNVTCL
ncbi:hypothetical protein L1D29_15325 [Shewanella insulae]|uniref:hypothetical protein n=1 Tax=Shewanella insulae TaxID=2681496 RepID=UPI001EFC8B69|nr:hypothetical protein [Shewanella insulae]MCG9714191.1 hypothetical protein [Shewanella insulae]